MNYPALLAAHGGLDSIIANPLFIFLFFNTGEIALISLAIRRWLLVGLTTLVNLTACYFIIFVSLMVCTGTTALHHLETTQFNGQIYQLARATHVSGDWDTVIFSLYLYECDSDGELCRGQSIFVGGQPIDPEDVRMTVDRESNELRVSYWQAVIFTLKSGGDFVDDQ